MSRTPDARVFWPRLSSLPSTNALLSLVGTLWLLTGLCALLPWTTLEPDARWYQALETFTGIIVVQFIGKRWTNGRGVKENGGNGAEARPQLTRA